MGCSSSNEATNHEFVAPNNQRKLTPGGTNAGSEGSLHVKGRDMIPHVEWSEINFGMDRINPEVLGKGSTAIVIKASLEVDGRNQDIAIKIMAKHKLKSEDEKDKLFDRVVDEVAICIDAENKLKNNNCIIKVYGMCEGLLPLQICSLLMLPPGTEGIGIVMRYEGGGTLDALIHKSRTKIKLPEKVRILRDIAYALQELHGMGMVHGDIKPKNILLSADKPPQIRLADFGFTVLQETSLMESTQKQTYLFRGTPIYSAPEMLFNPYREDLASTVSEVSRRTDMYAFGILSWEVLSEEQPFSEIRTIFELGARLHQGLRPDLNWLPQKTPEPIIHMIRLLWSGDRNERKTAQECYDLLKLQYDKLTNTNMDTFLIYNENPSDRMIYTNALDDVMQI